MNTKRIPAIVMLLGGTVACVVTYINHYDLQEMLMVLISALLVFLILGLVIKLILDSFKLPEEDKVDDEGEVVEKQPDTIMDGGTEEESSTENLFGDDSQNEF